MSEAGSPKKNVGWSEGEKMSLLLQIIKQQGGGDNMKVKWSEIHLPGRTPKSMTHVWSKIRQEANSFDTGDVAPVTPRKRGPPKAAKSEPPAKKRATPRKDKKAAEKSEAEESEHEVEAKMEDLDDGSGDETKAEDSPDEDHFEDV